MSEVKSLLSSGKKVYLVNGRRTPFGQFGGSLKDITPVDLAVHAAKKLLADIKINPDQIDQVILGNVCPSSTDTLYGARHLALKIDAPETTPGVVVNRLCGSGIESILDAVRLIKLGEAECILAGGVENMSMVPHLTYGGRFGTKYGALKNVDMLLDALTDKFSKSPMGITAENLARDYDISREECERFSVQSHNRLLRAYNDKVIQGEMAPIILKRGECSKDEHMREDINLGALAKLRPSFVEDGVVTPATASGIVDGAAITIVASEDFCKENNLTPLAEIVDGQVVGVDPTRMGIGPVPAINSLLKRNKMTLNEIDLIEINEAFAAQTLACIKELKWSEEKLNIWGGAIAMGHPLGASGTRISLTLARQLRHFGKDFGIASACIGGGQGIALLLRRA